MACLEVEDYGGGGLDGPLSHPSAYDYVSLTSIFLLRFVLVLVGESVRDAEWCSEIALG